MWKNDIDETKNYGKYQTLSILPEESKLEYESFIQPPPVKGTDIYASVEISAKESLMDIEKEMDLVIGGIPKKISVKIPAGRTFIKCQGEGEAGQWGGENGDLYIRVMVTPMPTVEEKQKPIAGNDVHQTMYITLEEWKNGVQKELEVEVEGIKKKIFVKVPKGMQNGAALRYQGKGEIGKNGGKNGDLYIRVVIPLSERKKKVTEEEKDTETHSEEKNDVLENAISINITFMEAVKGVQKEVDILQKAPCKKCQGTGKTKDGKICWECNGKGYVEFEQKILVKIPAGIDNGHYIRLKSYKMPHQHLNKDIFIKVNVENHEKFTRKGNDIYSTEKIPSYIGSGQVVLVETLDGKHYYAVTKNVKDGTQICFQNKGVPSIKDPSVRGNHYVTWRK